MKILRNSLLLLFVMLWAVSACDSKDDQQKIIDETEQAKPNSQSDFDKLWSEEERLEANSAASAKYLTQAEKEIYYYLNLMRLNPSRFATTYAQAYNGIKGWEKGFAFNERKESLLRELVTTAPMPVVKPNEVLFGSADCFATSSGKQGLVGHDRTGTGCTANPGLAECVAASGYTNGLSVVMDFLVDAGEENEALSHRRILMNRNYLFMGAAIRTHKDYSYIVVLDFDSDEL